jgi:hypothetical protein
MYRLLNRYRLRHATPYRFALAEVPPDEELANDVQAARHLEGPSGDEMSDPLPGALSGVAAALVHRATKNDIDQITRESLSWARDLLLRFAIDPKPTAFNHPDAMYSLGADRHAALALPLLLLPPVGEAGPTITEPRAETLRSRVGLIQTCKAWISACSETVLAFSKKMMKLALRVDSQGNVADGKKPAAAVLTALEACTCSPLVEVRQNVAEGIGVLFDSHAAFKTTGVVGMKGCGRRSKLAPGGWCSAISRKVAGLKFN